MNKQAWIEAAKAKGIEAFEIYQLRENGRSVSWYEGDVENVTSSRTLGTSIRGIVDGKAANLAMESVDDSRMDETLDRLLDEIKAIGAEEKERLRQPEETEEVRDERTWKSPSMEEIKETMRILEQKALAFDPRVSEVTTVGWEEGAVTREIVNSCGMDVRDESGVQYLVLGIAVKDQDEVKDGYEIEVVRDLAALDLDGFVRRACEKTLDKLGGSPVPSGFYKVILEKDAMTDLFAALSGMFSGEMIYKGISPLKDKLGEKIMSDKITIVDDPRDLSAVSIRNYDDEGCPTRRKVLVEEGVFKTMLHCTKSADTMGAESTGNGFRGGFAGSVSVSPMNFCILPGERSLEEMQEAMGDGLVITDLQGLHAGLDPVTTNFSLQCGGYLVKDGKKERPVTLITVAANYLELMKTVTEVGSDLDWSYHHVVCPSIAFEGIAVSGE